MTDETIEEVINRVSRRAELYCAEQARWLSMQDSIKELSGGDALRFFATILEKTNQ